MGEKNSDRISHTIETSPNTFRGASVFDALNDLDEQLSGKGWTEIIKAGAFISSVIVWDKPTNNPASDPTALKRAEITVNRSGAFVSSVVTTIYKKDGIAVASVSTNTITRTGNNDIAFINGVTTRP